VIDLGGDADTTAETVTKAGLKVGSADLRAWSGITSADRGKREAALEENDAYISACAAEGITNFFTVMIPEDASKPRSENFALLVQGLQGLAPILEKNGGRLVIEGWPGAGALACTPEGYRATFREVPSPAIGINYDPSHLVRMGIDPIRFVEEFASRVYHVYGKDTELLAEGLYEYGTEQPPTFGKPRDFGGMHWRYTIPGHGAVRWGRAFEILVAAGYSGAVCIELEDDNFNGTEAGEKHGILAGATFLASA
jgi:sugar phosphate isomerase/epimerase